MRTRSQFEEVLSNRRRWLSLLVLTALMLGTSVAPLSAQTSPTAPEADALETDAPDADSDVGLSLEEDPIEPVLVLKKEVSENNVVSALISLPATQDTYVASNQSGSNYGSSGTLALGYNASGSNQGAQRILIKFDFPGGIPRGSTINSAKLRLYQTSATGESNMNTNVRDLVSGWSEYDVTWGNHEPDWGGIETYSDIGSSPGWYEWDITDLAKRWLNGSEANDGVLIQGNEVPTDHQRNFSSRQSGGNTPQLVIDFTAAAPDNTPPSSEVVRPRNQYQTDPDRTFRVQWRGDDNENGSGIDYYDVQYREPGGSWIDWQRQIRQQQAEFTGLDGRTYEFRVRAVDFAGNVESYPNDAEARTTVDVSPPNANIIQLPAFIGVTDFALSWSANDATSGVVSYDLQFQYGVQPWFDWVQNTTATTAPASGSENVTIQYRVRATDGAGNVSSYDAPGATTSTTVDLTAPTAQILSFASGETSNQNFTVRWSGDDGAGAGVSTYDVRWRFGSGQWQNWQQGASATSASFTAGAGQGVYSFQVRATDAVGNVGTFMPENGKGILFNQGAITLDEMLYMPITASN